jgi:hypothetical protein
MGMKASSAIAPAKMERSMESSRKAFEDRYVSTPP